MKSFVVAVAAFAALATANPLFEKRAPPGCTPDNCLRALTVTDSLYKTARPIMAQAACSSLAIKVSTITEHAPVSTAYETITTVVSTTTTTYTTGTTTSTIIIPTTIVIQHIAKREAVPPYASGQYLSACSSAARFASACACIGISPATITSTTTLAPEHTTITAHSTTTAAFIETSSLTETTSTTTINPVQTNYVNLPFNLKVGNELLNSGPRTAPYAHINIPFFAASGSPIVCAHSPEDRRLICDGNNVIFGGCEQYFQTSTKATQAEAALFNIDLETKHVTADQAWQLCPFGGQSFLVQGSTPCQPSCESGVTVTAVLPAPTV